MVRPTTTKQLGTGVPPNPRFSFAITTTIFVLTTAFFAAHQAWSTGFFLSSFTTLQAVLLYASILYGILVANTEVIGLREDHIAIINLVGAVLWTATTAWLYFTFPFDFTHFAAIVPWQLQFLVSWITNGIAKIIWLLLFLGSVAFIPFFGFQLNAARHNLHTTLS